MEKSPALKLRMATRAGDIEAISVLLDQGVDPDATVGITQRTPLSLALEAGKTDVARYLLERGANPNTRDGNGFTALYYATSAEQIALLLDYQAICQPIFPADWLIRRVMPEEARDYFTDTEFRNRVEAFLSLTLPEDELWWFDSPPETWNSFCGRRGYAIVKRGIPFRWLVTGLS